MIKQNIYKRSLRARSNCGLYLDKLSYELAEAMLSEYTNTWKLAFIDYLIERDNIKSIKRGLNEAIEYEKKEIL